MQELRDEMTNLVITAEGMEYWSTLKNRNYKWNDELFEQEDVERGVFQLVVNYSGFNQSVFRKSFRNQWKTLDSLIDRGFIEERFDENVPITFNTLKKVIEEVRNNEG